MKTKIIFLRHADTKKDPSVNAALWQLSDDGKKQATEVAENVEINSVDIIYTSKEPKTLLTIEPLNEKILKEVISSPSFNEVKRGDKFLSDEDFKKEKALQLTDLSYKAFNGESGIEALQRFKDGISKTIEENKGKTILIVSHGTILNIYFADILNINENIIERWKKTDFCAYGITEDNVVTKDIV